MAATSNHGWLRALRRFSGAGVLLFAVIFVVGALRAHALALASGDDELCVIMGGTAAVRPVAAANPADLADRSHACCDLGLCLDASALPPAAPALGLLARRALTRTVPLPPRQPVSRPRRAGYRPRGPPGR